MKQLLTLIALLFTLAGFAQKKERVVDNRIHRQHAWANNLMTTYGKQEKVLDTLGVNANGAYQWFVDVYAIHEKDTARASITVNVLKADTGYSITKKIENLKPKFHNAADHVYVGIEIIDKLAVVRITGIESVRKLTNKTVRWEVNKSSLE